MGRSKSFLKFPVRPTYKICMIFQHVAPVHAENLEGLKSPQLPH